MVLFLSRHIDLRRIPLYVSRAQLAPLPNNENEVKMNALGLSLIMRMGCICTRETVNINGIKYTVKERLGEG